MATSPIEYIVLAVMDGNVVAITPSNPQTQIALSPGSGMARAPLGEVLAKLTEHGYRLVPGVVVPATPTFLQSFIVMAREK